MELINLTPRVRRGEPYLLNGDINVYEEKRGIVSVAGYIDRTQSGFNQYIFTGTTILRINKHYSAHAISMLKASEPGEGFCLETLYEKNFLRRGLLALGELAGFDLDGFISHGVVDLIPSKNKAALPDTWNIPGIEVEGRGIIQTPFGCFSIAAMLVERLKELRVQMDEERIVTEQTSDDELFLAAFLTSAELVLKGKITLYRGISAATAKSSNDPYHDVPNYGIF